MLMQRLVIFLATLIPVSISQMNVAPLGNASQSSIYRSYTADKAIEGPASTKWSSGCSHTSAYKGTASWWKVEFSALYAFTNVTIYYRNFTLDPRRNDGYSLYITNDTSDTVRNPPNGTLYYEDEYGLPYPDYINTIDCHAIGRNVVIYKYGWSAFLELCYVKIYGCPIKQWGTNCTLPCSSNCNNQECDPENGSCTYGCTSNVCLNHDCDHNRICSSGCITGHSGQRCDKYKNLAVNGSASQHSGNISFPGDAGIDGDRKFTCTTLNGSDVWFQVDTGSQSFVSAVYLHFTGDLNNKSMKHYIYASNTSQDWADGVLLYSGGLPNKDIDVLNVCQYVTYVPPDDIPEFRLELCEMEVIGCPVGKYGPLCDKICSSRCDGLCHPDTGTCISGCKIGLMGDKCDKACNDWHYGKNCTEICNCLDKPCNKSSGLCPNGECKKGWTGPACNKECSHGRYGQNCVKSCDGCISDDCDRFMGICSINNTCRAGFKFEPKCNTPCNDWSYGKNCTETCNCRDIPCNKSNGLCLNVECKKGWMGPSCNKECGSGFFGENCSSACIGCIAGACDHLDGVCTVNFQCKPGWKFGRECNIPCDDGYYGKNCTVKCNCFGTTCDKASGECINLDGCDIGYYGANCSKSCTGCLGDSCDRFDGLCTIGHKCKPGWKYEPKCNTSCDDWYYGENCTGYCNCLNAPCEKSTGQCSDEECKIGWKGKSCDEECSAGEYGKNCLGICSGCVNHTCDTYDGNCTYGCLDGYQGHLCKFKIEATQAKEESTNVYIPIGVVLGVVVIVSIPLTVVSVYKRKKKTEHDKHLIPMEKTDKRGVSEEYVDMDQKKRPPNGADSKNPSSSISYDQLEVQLENEGTRDYLNDKYESVCEDNPDSNDYVCIREPIMDEAGKSNLTISNYYEPIAMRTLHEPKDKNVQIADESHHHRKIPDFTVASPYKETRKSENRDMKNSNYYEPIKDTSVSPQKPEMDEFTLQDSRPGLTNRLPNGADIKNPSLFIQYDIVKEQTENKGTGDHLNDSKHELVSGDNRENQTGIDSNDDVSIRASRMDKADKGYSINSMYYEPINTKTFHEPNDQKVQTTD